VPRNNKTANLIFLKKSEGDYRMVTELGINMLVPIITFGFIIVGAYMMSNWAFGDVIDRRNKSE